MEQWMESCCAMESLESYHAMALNEELSNHETIRWSVTTFTPKRSSKQQNPMKTRWRDSTALLIDMPFIQQTRKSLSSHLN